MRENDLMQVEVRNDGVWNLTEMSVNEFQAPKEDFVVVCEILIATVVTVAFLVQCTAVAEEFISKFFAKL